MAPKPKQSDATGDTGEEDNDDGLSGRVAVRFHFFIGACVENRCSKHPPEECHHDVSLREQGVSAVPHTRCQRHLIVGVDGGGADSPRRVAAASVMRFRDIAACLPRFPSAKSSSARSPGRGSRTSRSGRFRPTSSLRFANLTT